VRFVLDLITDDEQATVRLLKRLLKLLGRAYGIRCKGVRPSDGETKDA
jgi:hypothetical protein